MTALIRGVLVGGLAGLLFGFDTAVIAGTTQDLTTEFTLDATGLGLTVSSALWGTLAGALFAGKPGDRFGARNCLRGIAVLYLVSALGCLLAPSLGVLIAARVVGGLAIGASSVLAPVYLAEIAPARRRGMLVGAFQFNIVLGILVAYLSNYLLGFAELGADEWRWKFGVAALPSMLLFGLLFAIPNSPRWLAAKGRMAEARDVLVRIGAADVDGELEACRRAGARTGAKLTWRHYGKPMFLAVTIAAFNQLSGINAILYYSNQIFASAGFGKASADLQSVAIGATNLLFTLLALLLIDRVGRKALLIGGSAGMVVALSATAFIQWSGVGTHLLLAALILFIASFACSQGAVIWVYISEIFPTEVRARGQSLGASTHWLMDAIVAGVFPLMAARSTGLPFVLFAIAMLAQILVVHRYFIETKGVRLEEMATAMRPA